MGNANGGGICAGSRELSAEEELDDAALLTEISIDDDVPGRKLSEKEFAEDLKKSLTGSLFSKHQEVDNMINSGNDQGLEMKSETQEKSIKKRNEIEYWKNVNISPPVNNTTNSETNNNKETRAEATTVDDEKGESNGQNDEVKIETAKEEEKEENVTNDNKHLAQVDSSLTLDLDYGTVPKSGTPEREKYENQIATDFSNCLGIDKDRFQMKSIKSGSVIIDFSILPSIDGSGMIAEHAATLLEKQVSDPASTLYTSPNIQILKAVNPTKSLAGGKLFKKMALNPTAVTKAALRNTVNKKDINNDKKKKHTANNDKNNNVSNNKINNNNNNNDNNNNNNNI